MLLKSCSWCTRWLFVVRTLINQKQNKKKHCKNYEYYKWNDSDILMLIKNLKKHPYVFSIGSRSAFEGTRIFIFMRLISFCFGIKKPFKLSTGISNVTFFLKYLWQFYEIWIRRVLLSGNMLIVKMLWRCWDYWTQVLNIWFEGVILKFSALVYKFIIMLCEKSTLDHAC